MNEHNKTYFLEKVQGRKKERNYYILQMLANGFTQPEVIAVISKIFHCHLTQARVSQIEVSNREVLDELTLTADLATKAGRIRKALKVINHKGERSMSDLLDWMKYLRVEVEGEKGIDVKVGVGVNINRDSADGNGAIDKDLQHRLREHFGIGRSGVQEEQQK